MFEPRKVGWSDLGTWGLREGGGGGGLSKGGGTEKRGKETKISKRGRGKLGQGVGALKRGWGDPLRTIQHDFRF